MSLATHIASNTAGERDVLLVQLNHVTWPFALRYADDTRNWLVNLEDDTAAIFTATAADATAPGTNESGGDSRTIDIPDPELVLWQRLEALAGNTLPVEVKVYIYLTTDLSQPAAYAILTMANPARSGRRVTFEAVSVNTQNRDAPTLRFTYANSPGLRR